ncbi:hypothetical protein EYF80_043930 [Liparis tanakae]|uniref:Uncharacterized protein n=1 Tax=Liparis tanakae TaxID=230148 RepID=A0A4Z2FYA6_9TELE|nr:hypothetical protein EYF80_043930 [Liparis tanakae]
MAGRELEDRRASKKITWLGSIGHASVARRPDRRRVGRSEGRNKDGSPTRALSVERQRNTMRRRTANAATASSSVGLPRATWPRSNGATWPSASPRRRTLKDSRCRAYTASIQENETTSEEGDGRARRETDARLYGHRQSTRVYFFQPIKTSTPRCKLWSPKRRAPLTARCVAFPSTWV